MAELPHGKGQEEMEGPWSPSTGFQCGAGQRPAVLGVVKQIMPQLTWAEPCTVARTVGHWVFLQLCLFP